MPFAPPYIHCAAVDHSPTTVSSDDSCRVSIVFPCLNEEAAIGRCVDQAMEALAPTGLPGEVLVVDNGSTDRTAEIARHRGARVVTEPRRGYGRACLRGLHEARGDFVVLLDADGSYPVEMVGTFVRLMQDGRADVVLGNRFGGGMERGAMPLLNRYLGNPVLSAMTRVLFRAPLTDIHCGMRGIRRDRVAALDLRMPGMEFATEMLVKALDHGLAVQEVSIGYRPRLGASKLRPLRDAWRHAEYMLVFSPSLLFIWPGITLFLLGTALQVLLVSGPRMLFFRVWDVHTNLAGLAAALVGVTLLGLGLVGATFAWSIGMRFRHSPLARAAASWGDRPVRLAAVPLALAGAAMWTAVIVRWVASGFGALAAVPYLSLATTFLASGLELLVAAFLVHIIRLKTAAESGE
ncbi:MAG: glycosyltransferase family 2 protein [Gemmatimonadetes bacterium]|nr:glycosyltransferase family 2 protein [Gemmatimonadota bacterium]